MNKTFILLLAGLALPPGLPAQVRTVPEAFPLAPAAGVALPVRPYGASPVMPALAAPPAAPPQLVIRKGQPLGEELRVHGQRAGWELHWEAPLYVAERDLVLAGDFEAALENLLQGANAAGTRMRAVFYRGNRTVRVSED